MNIHSLARTTPASRALIVHRICQFGWSVPRAAEAAGISERTVYKWLARYRQGGSARFRIDQAGPTAVPLNSRRSGPS